VDVRLIAATNRDIIEAIRLEQFREDLYHRLNVVQFRPPPLRERGEDVLRLAEHFLAQFNGALNKSIRGIKPLAQQMLLGHHWPGNVRELRNVIERAVILETTAEIQPTSLPDFQLETRLRKSGLPRIAGQSLEEAVANFERELIATTLEHQHYNLAKAAGQLRITRHALRYRMNRLNITAPTAPNDEASAPEPPDTVP
jgi:transcriptional regulator with PAS, ATPase and Fis domain